MIVREVNAGFERSIFRGIDIGVGSDAGDEVESVDGGEVGLEVGFRDYRSDGKYVKCGLNVRINDSLN